MKSSLATFSYRLFAARLGIAVLGNLAMVVLASATVINAAPADPGSSTADQTVSIAAFAFAPAELSVSVGTTLSWTNAQDGVQHTTSSSDGVWDSGPLATGDTFAVTFNQTGDFAYICAIHPSMHGTVHVVGDTNGQSAISAPDPAPTTTVTSNPTATPAPQTAVQQSTPTPSPTPRLTPAPTTPTATPAPYYKY